MAQRWGNTKPPGGNLLMTHALNDQVTKHPIQYDSRAPHIPMNRRASYIGLRFKLQTSALLAHFPVQQTHPTATTPWSSTPQPGPLFQSSRSLSSPMYSIANCAHLDRSSTLMDQPADGSPKRMSNTLHSLSLTDFGTNCILQSLAVPHSRGVIPS